MKSGRFEPIAIALRIGLRRSVVVSPFVYDFLPLGMHGFCKVVAVHRSRTLHRHRSPRRGPVR